MIPRTDVMGYHLSPRRGCHELRPSAACGAAGAYFRPVICGPNSLNNSTHESQMAE